VVTSQMRESGGDQSLQRAIATNWGPQASKLAVGVSGACGAVGHKALSFTGNRQVHSFAVVNFSQGRATDSYAGRKESMRKGGKNEQTNKHTNAAVVDLRGPIAGEAA